MGVYVTMMARSAQDAPAEILHCLLCQPKFCTLCKLCFVCFCKTRKRAPKTRDVKEVLNECAKFLIL